MKKRPILIILITIILVNFAYAVVYNIKPIVDAEAYDEIATNIQTLGEYRSLAGVPVELDSSIQRVGPGYEVFLGINYILFGRHLWIIWFLQAILYGLTIIMLGFMSLELFPNLRNNMRLVYGTMLGFGLLIDAVQLNGMLMTESLFLFLLTSSFFIWSKIYRNTESSRLMWILLGIALGLQTLVRPTGLLIFILITAITFYKHKTKAFISLLLMLFAFLAIQIPWFVRNYKIYHQFVFHSSTDGLNFLSGNYPGNHGEFNADFPFYKELKSKYESPVDFNNAAQKWYRDFVIVHPLQATSILFEKAVLCLSLAKTSGFWFHYLGKFDQILTILLSILYNFIILTSILLFILLSIKKIKNRSISKEEIFANLSIIILITTPILAVIANRHRLPLTVMSLPIVIYILDILIKNYKNKKMLLNVAVVIFIIGLATSYDVYIQFDKFKERLHRVNTTTLLNIENHNA